MDDYAVVNVAPSVVPNPYLPSFRIYSYNTTGGTERPSEQEKRRHGHRRGSDGNNATCKSDKYADTWRCHLESSVAFRPKLAFTE
jgi:endopolyphosphatase